MKELMCESVKISFNVWNYESVNVLEKTAHRTEHTTLCNLQYLIIIVVQKCAKAWGRRGEGGCTGALSSFAVKEAAEAPKTGPDEQRS